MWVEKVIQSGSSWITAWRRVPGLGFTMSLSEESVTTYLLPAIPPVVPLPNPSAHLANLFRFLSQLGRHRQQASIGLVNLQGPLYLRAKILLVPIIFSSFMNLCASKHEV